MLLLLFDHIPFLLFQGTLSHLIKWVFQIEILRYLFSISAFTCLLKSPKKNINRKCCKLLFHNISDFFKGHNFQMLYLLLLISSWSLHGRPKAILKNYRGGSQKFAWLLIQPTSFSSSFWSRREKEPIPFIYQAKA